MPELSALDPTKIQQLKSIRAAGQSVVYQTFIVFYWPDTIGKKVYAVAPYDNARLFPKTAHLVPEDLKPVETRLIAPGAGSPTQAEEYIPSFSLSGDVKDNSLSFALSNLDGQLEEAYWTCRYGVKIELIVWMPQAELRKNLWTGYTLPLATTTGPVLKFTASHGVRSNQRMLPNAPPYPLCGNEFPPDNPVKFPTIASIVGNRCPFDKHLAGTNGLGGRTTCNHTSGDCILNWGAVTNLPYTGVDAIQILNGLPVRRDSHTLDATRGNSSNLSDPIRVQGGQRIVKELDIVQITVQTNPDHPERGSVSLTCIGGEGPVGGLVLGTKPSINDVPVDAAQTQFRNGLVRQSTTGFIPGVPVGNFSSRWILHVVQAGSFAGSTAQNFNVKCHITGLNNLRIYTTPTIYTVGYSANPAWFALMSLKDTLWGLGIDIDSPNSLVFIQDWIDAAAYFDQTVSGINPDGTHTTITRSVWNGEWRGRPAQDQLHDFFAYRFCSPLFMFEGKLRMLPLTKWVLDQDVVKFTDRDDAPYRNILPDAQGISTSDCGEISIDRQPNQIEARFDDQDLDDYAERPLMVEDRPAQLEAGRRTGTNTIFKVKSPHFFPGITKYGEAVRAANRLLDMGVFDEGGLKNPISWAFECSFLDSLTLHPYKVIEQDSKKLDKMLAVWGFKYFRIQRLDFSGLRVKVTSQAYPEGYFDDLENPSTPLPRPGGGPIIRPPNAGGPPGGRPKQPILTLPTITDDGIEFGLELN